MDKIISERTDKRYFLVAMTYSSQFVNRLFTPVAPHLHAHRRTLAHTQVRSSEVVQHPPQHHPTCARIHAGD